MPLILSNVNNSGGFSLTGNSGRFSATSTSAASIVTDGLLFLVDANDAASYGGSGTTWTDLAGTQDNITLVGSPTFTSGTPSYFTFNGSSQYGTGTGNVVPAAAYSKCVWFYLNGTADNNLLSSAAGGHFMFFASTSKMYCGHANWPVYTAFESVTTFSNNQWYFAVLTFNTTDGMKLYINGTLDNTYTANKTQRGGNGTTNVATFGGGNLLNGRISKGMTYNKVLSQAEITQNFNADKSKFGL